MELRIDFSGSGEVTKGTDNGMAESDRGISVPRSENEPHHHPLGAGIGAVLAASTVGATGGVLVGPLGAIVGAVIGAVAGGLGGSAIAELVDPTSLEVAGTDAYTTRLHVHGSVDPTDADGTTDSSDQKPAQRNSWGHHESRKELLIDDPPIDDA